MVTLRKFALGAFLTVSALGTVTMTSCKKDDDGCEVGYEGSGCKTEIRAKFVKVWNAEDTPPSGAKKLYSCPIVNGSSITAVTISKSFSENFFENNINATVSGTTITIAPQEPDSDGFKVEGSGTISGGKISWTYTISGVGTPVTTTGVWQ